jgi:hypothetical protein
MLLVDDLQHPAQRRLQFRIVRRRFGHGSRRTYDVAPRRAAAASCMVSGSKS